MRDEMEKMAQRIRARAMVLDDSRHPPTLALPPRLPPPAISGKKKGASRLANPLFFE